MKTLFILLLSSVAASAMAAPSHLLIKAETFGYKIGDNSGNSEVSTLYKLPISAVWMDKLVVNEKSGSTGMVCRVTIRKESPSLSFLVWVHKTKDSRFSIYAFGSGGVKVGSETIQYRGGTATSTSVFKTLEDFDFAQQVSFKNGTHGKNVEISVRVSEDSTLLGQAKAVRVEGKDRQVLIEGSGSDPDSHDISCSIQ